MITGQQAAFGAALRREREKRRIPLLRVAESTKISQSLLASLERGDASRWPSGIYRRAFLREYAAAIGLSPETTVTEFCRLFPEGGATAKTDVVDTELRLTFAHETGINFNQLAVHATAVIIDLLIVAALGSLLTIFWTSESRLEVFGLAAVFYYTVGTICLGRSAGLWLLHTTQARRDRLPEELLDFGPASSSEPVELV